MAEVAEVADERRVHLQRMWAAVAPSWGVFADYTDMRHASETALMLDRLAPEPGERVLELACGAGGLGLAAAERVGPHGTVVLSDVVSEMVQIAAARANRRGLANTTARVLDLEQIDEPDEHYDLVVCRDGLQFTLDPARAVAEMVRVTRPSGRIGLAVWGERERNPWLGIVLDVASAELGRPLPPPGMPGPFALADPEGLREMLATAGLVDVGVDEVSVPMVAGSFDEWWPRTCGLAGPLSSILATLAPPAAKALRSRAQAAVGPYLTSTGLVFDGLALVATARRSSPPHE